ncbi:MAG: cation:proton antiporter [Bacteroidales bacterium]|nr:cation:proton antiporter [Bacteroidales bacterium]
MKLTIIIIALGMLIFSSHLFNELFNKTKIPNVLLLLLIGIVIGPISGLVTKDFFGEIGGVFTTITLIVILFESGAGLQLGEIKQSIGSAAILTVVNFLFTVIVAALLSRFLLSLSWLSALFLGSIVGGTSSAVVIPMVRQLKLGNRSTSILILESALSDVLCLVVGLALLDGMRQGQVSVQMVFSKMWKAFLFAIMIGLAGGLAWSVLINLMRGLKNSMITTLAFVFILYGLVDLLHLNGGIAVLSFGIVLANVELLSGQKLFQKAMKFKTSGFTDTERSFFAEIVFIMQTYFFVYVGISIQFGSFWTYLVGLLVVILIILVRIPPIQLFIGKKVSGVEKSVMSVMSPKGLVPAVLASIPLQENLNAGKNLFTDADKILDLGYSIVLFSIVISSVLVIILSIKPDFFQEKIRKYRERNKISESNPAPAIPDNDINSGPADEQDNVVDFSK